MPDPISWGLVWKFYLAALAGGYLLGSIPFGLIVTRLAGTEDIRTIGSGNIGATNVLRTGRKSLAIMTLLGDALKGTLAALLGARWGPDIAVIAAFGALPPRSSPSTTPSIRSPSSARSRGRPSSTAGPPVRETTRIPKARLPRVAWCLDAVSKVKYKALTASDGNKAVT